MVCAFCKRVGEIGPSRSWGSARMRGIPITKVKAKERKLFSFSFKTWNYACLDIALLFLSLSLIIFFSNCPFFHSIYFSYFQLFFVFFCSFFAKDKISFLNFFLCLSSQCRAAFFSIRDLAWALNMLRLLWGTERRRLRPSSRRLHKNVYLLFWLQRKKRNFVCNWHVTSDEGRKTLLYFHAGIEVT